MMLRVHMQDSAATRLQSKTLDHLIACKSVCAMQAIAQPSTKPRITVGTLIGIYSPYAVGTTQPSLDGPVVCDTLQTSWIQHKQPVNLCCQLFICCTTECFEQTRSKEHKHWDITHLRAAQEPSA